ncbi:MAG: SUMF1/EgtB/PvdO family nonheme iron enzyme [Treponema sp.]|jgi:formylglycine-generating enzyme required for sulfatase activity|nr:SUMF1/EgtB/PvdO family nonheme iron enzyme [Treponema sp.]
MSKYEVTQEEWWEVMGSSPSYFKGDDLPVEMVSWYDTVEYCNKRSELEGLTPAYTIDKTRRDPSNKNIWKVFL